MWPDDFGAVAAGFAPPDEANTYPCLDATARKHLEIVRSSCSSSRYEVTETNKQDPEHVWLMSFPFTNPLGGHSLHTGRL